MQTDELLRIAVNELHVGGNGHGRNKYSVEFPDKSECMEAVLRLAFKISQSDEPLLITGETGTGKEHMARAIHNMGLNSENLFLAVDCSTLTGTLIESELFGHVRGAFTGAVQDKKGLFEAAGDGTVFLDEVGAMPLELQSTLLRVLQNREIRPVGGTKYVQFHARIIIATNVDLELAVQQRTFRQDLYFRLKVLTLELPTLLQHREDIPLLANYFLAHVSNCKGEHWGFSIDALNCLKAYSWPGNVRELENAIRSALVWGVSPVVQVGDLPLNIQKPKEDSLSEGPILKYPKLLWDIERQAILRALSEADGDKSLAAGLLGIGKTTIYRKLKEYGIPRHVDFTSLG